jgi:hypothetical protein
MRKVAGVLFAAAMVLPIGLVVSPAGAATGTTCKTTSGTATFSPALPKIGNKTLVNSTITVKNGKLGGCNNGVTAGAVTLSAKILNANCSALVSPPKNAKPTTGTEKITWTPASKGTSTIPVTLGTVKGHPTETTLSGTVSAGTFKGTKISGTVVYTIPSGACQKTALSTVTFTQFTPQSI